MPYRCPHCGKEHATLEELQANDKRMRDVSTIDESPGTTMIEIGYGSESEPETDD